MLRNQLTALAALVLVSTPGVAFELKEPSPGVMFYYSLPLDARNAKERSPALGISMRGKHDYQALTVDTRMINSFSALGGIDAKWIVAGVVVVGAAIAVGSRDKSTSASYEQQQVQQQQNQGPCAVSSSPRCPH